MATYVIYADAADGYVSSENTTYSTARAGSTLDAQTGYAQVFCGQEKTVGTYYLYEAFLSFDTSSVPAARTSATLSLYVHDDSSTAADFTINARAYDWGSTLTTGDFVAGASLSGNALRASRSTSGLTLNAYNDLTSDSSFVSNLSNPVRLLLSSSRMENGDVPGTSTQEYIAFRSTDQTGTSNDPKLTIVAYTASTFTADAVVISEYDRTVRTTSGLQSYWPLNETSGSTATDALGAVNGTKGSGVTFGGTAVTPVAGGYSAYFNGDAINANINLGNNYKFAGTASWSVEAWFNSDNFNPTNNSNHIFGAYDGTTGYRVAVSDTGVFFATRKTGGEDNWSGSTLSTGTTYHLVVTYDGSNIRGYVNGAVVGSTQASTRSVTAPSTNAFISSTYSGVGAMDGNLDNVAVYNTALSAATIAEHYAAGVLRTTFTADAIISDTTRTKTFTADGVVYDPLRTNTFTADAHIVQDSWGLGAWSRRKLVGLSTPGATARTNYPVTVTVTYDSDMQSDFDDVRFTSPDGSTLLTYWRGAYTASTSATFYVVIPTLKAGGGVIYMYYGNSAASYAGQTLGANGAFGTLDGGSAVTISNAATYQLTKGAAGTWKERFLTGGHMVKNLDGTLYRDVDGYAYGVTNGASNSKTATATGTQTDDDRPGMYRTTDFTDMEEVGPQPFLTWASGTWDGNSGTVWDGRVVQQGQIFYDENGDTGVAAGSFICFFDGDAGPARVIEAYRQGVAIGVGANPGVATWTKHTTGNPSGQAWTFAHSYLNAFGYNDSVAYAGDFIYDEDEPDSNKRWKQWYTGISNGGSGGSGWGVMYATSPSHLGPWTRYSTSWVFEPDPAAPNGFYGGIGTVFKLRGIYYMVWERWEFGYDGNHAELAMSADGISWTNVGVLFSPGSSGAFDDARITEVMPTWDVVNDQWAMPYAGNSGTQNYIAATSWSATPAFLSVEPSASFASEQTAAPKTFTADAVVSAAGSSASTKTFTADAVITAPAYSATFTADGIVFATSTKTFTADLVVVDSSSQSTALSWFFRRRRSSMTPQTKTYTVVQAKGTTRTATWTSPTYQSKTEAGILVVLDVTSASGTGGLTLRINAQDSAGSVSVPLNSAPTAVTATGTTSYALYPFGAISGALTQSTSGYLPREFSISVTHGDSSSYTYSVGYCLLP